MLSRTTGRTSTSSNSAYGQFYNGGVTLPRDAGVDDRGGGGGTYASRSDARVGADVANGASRASRASSLGAHRERGELRNVVVADDLSRGTNLGARGAMSRDGRTLVGAGLGGGVGGSPRAHPERIHAVLGAGGGRRSRGGLDPRDPSDPSSANGWSKGFHGTTPRTLDPSQGGPQSGGGGGFSSSSSRSNAAAAGKSSAKPTNTTSGTGKPLIVASHPGAVSAAGAKGLNGGRLSGGPGGGPNANATTTNNPLRKSFDAGVTMTGPKGAQIERPSTYASGVNHGTTRAAGYLPQSHQSKKTAKTHEGGALQRGPPPKAKFPSGDASAASRSPGFGSMTIPRAGAHVPVPTFRGDAASASPLSPLSPSAREGVSTRRNGGATRIPFGAHSMAGGTNGFSKENQDDHFVLGTGGGVSGDRDFIAAVLDGHGVDGRKVSHFVRARLRSELEPRAGVATAAGKAKARAAAARVSASSGAVGDAYAAAAAVGVGASSPDNSSLPPTRFNSGADVERAAETSKRLTEAFRAAQAALVKNNGINSAESGSTAVTCARDGDVLTVANVGDSRCVLAREAQPPLTYATDPLGAAKKTPLVAVDLSSGASHTLVPIRPRSRGERRSSRTFLPGGASLRPGSLAFNPDAHTSTPFNSASDAFQLHPADHKPNRPDEEARVTRANGVVEPARSPLGGFVGPHRVWKKHPRTGGLAVSRAFGDTALSGAGVIAEPELFTERVTRRDKFVVLASDGVWDHVDSQEAVELAGACFESGAAAGAGAGHGGAAQRAADAIVARACERWKRAMNGGYRDDITCVVVPLLGWE